MAACCVRIGVSVSSLTVADVACSLVLVLEGAAVDALRRTAGGGRNFLLAGIILILLFVAFPPVWRGHASGDTSVLRLAVIILCVTRFFPVLPLLPFAGPCESTGRACAAEWMG